MGEPIKVFFVEHTDRMNVYLRRYRGGTHKCPATGSYCDAMVFFCETPKRDDKDGSYQSLKPGSGPPIYDPRWPKHCEACGMTFGSDDPFQLFPDTIMRALDGRTWPRRDLPAGACYNAFWNNHHVGPDGRSLIVILPTKNRHTWCIDSRASNCTMKDDNVHKCWVRHGSPEEGNLHVDKNGHTCAAGAGSILADGYHGFLHNGALTAC